MGVRTSLKCVAAFILGILAVAAGMSALTRRPESYLLAALAFTLGALITGIWGWREVSQKPDRLRGKGIAAAGIALPVASLCLALAVLPNV